MVSVPARNFVPARKNLSIKVIVWTHAQTRVSLHLIPKINLWCLVEKKYNILMHLCSKFMLRISKFFDSAKNLKPLRVFRLLCLWINAAYYKFDVLNVMENRENVILQKYSMHKLITSLKYQDKSLSGTSHLNGIDDEKHTRTFSVSIWELKSRTESHFNDSQQVKQEYNRMIVNGGWFSDFFFLRFVMFPRSEVDNENDIALGAWNWYSSTSSVCNSTSDSRTD